MKKKGVRYPLTEANKQRELGAEQAVGEPSSQRERAQIKALYTRLMQAQESEKLRLSRELHDGVVQILVALKLELCMIQKEYTSTEGLGEKLKGCIDMVEDMQKQVHTQAVSLRPPSLDDMGLVPAVRNMVEGFMRRTGIETELSYSSQDRRLPQDMELALYRCIQEGLTNIWQHAGAQHAWVDIGWKADQVEVEIGDDGCGFQPGALQVSSEHIGLVGMRERIHLLNGRMHVDSSPGEGTEIRIVLPVVDEEGKSEGTPEESETG